VLDTRERVHATAAVVSLEADLSLWALLFKATAGGRTHRAAGVGDDRVFRRHAPTVQ
jgi:hypothetical protein